MTDPQDATVYDCPDPPDPKVVRAAPNEIFDPEAYSTSLASAHCLAKPDMLTAGWVICDLCEANWGPELNATGYRPERCRTRNAEVQSR
jgi:hypothetical protein